METDGEVNSEINQLFYCFVIPNLLFSHSLSRLKVVDSVVGIHNVFSRLGEVPRGEVSNLEMSRLPLS